MQNFETLQNQSPWTYESDSFNPNLTPTNSTTRKRRSRLDTSIPGTSHLPPYHPDYGKDLDAPQYSSDESSDEHLDGNGKIRVRRGSEGYEVRPQQREDMLRQYLEEVGEEEAGKYIRYIPQPDTDSEDDDELPLGTRKDIIAHSVA